MKLLSKIFLPGAIALICVGTAHAQGSPDSSSDFESQLAAVQAQSDNQGSVPLAGMTVFIDEETGQFRAPTAEEAAALSAEINKPLNSAAAPAARSDSYAMIRSTNDAIGVRLGASQMVYTMATVGADGKVTQNCFHGSEEATDYLHNHVATAEEK